MNEQFADIMNFQILGPRVLHWIMIGFVAIIFLVKDKNGARNEQ